jgi:hypothetical protein
MRKRKEELKAVCLLLGSYKLSVSSLHKYIHGCSTEKQKIKDLGSNELPIMRKEDSRSIW